jgi:sRNA-binding regulator protein Hfq
MKRLYFGILAGVLLMASTVLAQTSTVDVLYLKNGSVIRGQVTSMTTKVVKIQTADGSLFVYPMKAVAKMEKITSGSTALEDSTSDESMQPVSTELVQPIAVPEPETKPVKQGVHFGIRGAIFLNIAIWDQLAKGAYLAQDPDSKLGLGIWGIIAPGITIGDDMFVGLGISIAPNFWSHTQTVLGHDATTSIGVNDVGGNLVFGFDDMYFVLGTGSASVKVSATYAGESSSIDLPESASWRRVGIGFGDGVGFGISYVSFTEPYQNLGRFEFNVGWSF